MPSIVLRHISESDLLTRATESLGYQFDRKWSPGEARTKSRNHENFGFNLCLVDREDIPVGKCLQEALHQVDELETALSHLGQSLCGCTLDLGIFAEPSDFTRTARLSASQSARLGNLGVDFEVSFYPSSEAEP